MNLFDGFPTLTAISALVVMAASVSPGDQTFAQNAASSLMAEIHISQLAVDKASTPKVGDFGQRLVNDQTRIADQLETIASRQAILLPSGISTQDQPSIDQLAGISGLAFDRAFLTEMARRFQADIPTIEKEANGGDDPDLKSFAAKALPVLREQLQTAREMAASLGAAPTE
ncbi:MAG TPA: DUF4142 domain-containing protein [Bryobacteraceae bacterium]|jgi:putative membrane protein|nr:DUF4142 domain-containing protein [Bryobacteraceae bacterium]